MAINAGEILVRFRADSQQAVREFTRFQRTLNKTITTTRAQVQDLNRSINGFSLAAGAGLGAAVLKIGSNFDKAITNVRAITKETEEQFESSRAQAIILASEYGKAADEVGGALFQIVSAGKRGEEAFQALTAATKLGRAGLVDTALATDVLIGSLNTFKFSGDEAEDVAGKLIGTVDRGILTFEQLANKVGQVSPVAQAAGVEFEELLAILALLTRNGVNFAQAVTQARGAIVKLVAPGKEARVEIEKLLGGTIEANLATLGFVGTLEKLIAASDGSVSTFKKLFEDVEAIQGVAAIASAGFQELRGDIDGLRSAGADTLNRTLEIQANSFAALSSELSNLIQNRVVAFFENNQEAIIGTTQALIDFLRENEAFVDIIIASTAALAGLSAAGLALKLVLTGLDTILGVTQFALNALTTSTTVNAAATTTNATATTASTATYVANTTATAANAATQTTNTASRAANTTAIVLQSKAITVQNTQLTANAFALNGNIAAQRKYVTNTAVTTAATSGFGAAIKRLFPTFIRLPALIGAGLAALKGFTIALTIVAAKVLLVIGVFTAFFKLGQAIGRTISGNTKEYEEQAKRLTELEKVQARIGQRTVQRLLQERGGRDQARVAAEEYREVLRQLTQAQNEANAGSAQAARDVVVLTDRLQALAPASEDAIGSATEQLERYENVVRNALRETEQLSDAYFGAFTEGGRLVSGFGESLAELSALEISLGADNAQQIVDRIRELKDEISGVAEQERRLAEASERASTATGLLGNVLGQTRLTTEEYSKSLDALLDRSRQLTQGEFTQTFNVIRDDLIASSDAVDGLIREIERLSDTTKTLQLQGADPTLVQEAVEEIAKLEGELDRAAEAAERFNQALLGLVAEQQEEILQSRLEAIDDIKQAEINALREVGQEREADLLAAELRREQSLRRVQEALDEEIERRKEINELINAGNLTDAEREALELTIQRSDALTELYEGQAEAIEEAYDRELQAIERNDDERQRRLQEEAKRRQLIALEQEKSDQARLAIQAIIDENISAEVAARQRIAELELEIIAAKGIQSEKELELLDSVKERIELLREEVESLRRAGQDLDDQIRSARDAQRDTGGTSDIEGGREDIRDTLDDAQTEEGVQAISEAFKEALETEFLLLQEKLLQAEKEGDAEAVQEIRERLTELNEIFRIFTDETQQRLAAIAEEAAARQANQIQGPPAPGQGGPQQPQPSQTTQNTPGGSTGTQSTSPGSQTQGTQPQEQNTTVEQVSDRVNEEAENVKDVIRTANAELNQAAENFGAAIADMGSEVVAGFTTVTSKLTELTSQVNANTQDIREARDEAARLRIEGR